LGTFDLGIFNYLMTIFKIKFVNGLFFLATAVYPYPQHGAPYLHNAAPNKRNLAHDTLLHRTQSSGPHACDAGSVWGGCDAPVGWVISSRTGRYSGGVRECFNGSSSGCSGFRPDSSETDRVHDSGTGFFKGGGIRP
jgi:hypothetical protein